MHLQIGSKKSARIFLPDLKLSDCIRVYHIFASPSKGHPTNWAERSFLSYPHLNFGSLSWWCMHKTTLDGGVVDTHKGELNVPWAISYLIWKYISIKMKYCKSLFIKCLHYKCLLIIKKYKSKKQLQWQLHKTLVSSMFFLI